MIEHILILCEPKVNMLAFRTIYIYIYIAQMFKDWSNKTNSGLRTWQNVRTKTNTLLYTENLIMTEYGVIR
jgi:hypothetical protein